MCSCLVLAKIMLLNFYRFLNFNSKECKEKSIDMSGDSAIQIFYHKYICDKILDKNTLS